jgi:sugar phosphate isomerase/epimerase
VQLFASSSVAAQSGFREALGRLARLGYDGLEASASRLSASGEARADVAAAARQSGMTLTVHAPLGGLNFAATEPAAAKRALDSALETLRIAADLGARLIVVHPGCLGGGNGDGEVV